MTLESLSLFLLVTTVYSLVPGPAVMLTVSQAMTYGPAASLRGIAGIAVMNLLFCVLAALGVGLLVQAFPAVFRGVQWIGAAYLVWIAVQTIRYPVTPERLAAAAARRPTGRLFWDGIAVQASNPKAILYLAAFLPQFINPELGHIGLQMFLLCLIGTVVDVPVLASYGWLGGRAVRFATKPAYSRMFAWVAGLLLIGAAAGVSGLFDHAKPPTDVIPDAAATNHTI